MLRSTRFLDKKGVCLLCSTLGVAAGYQWRWIPQRCRRRPLNWFPPRRICTVHFKRSWGCGGSKGCKNNGAMIVLQPWWGRQCRVPRYSVCLSDCGGDDVGAVLAWTSYPKVGCQHIGLRQRCGDLCIRDRKKEKEGKKKEEKNILRLLWLQLLNSPLGT